tara:strand:+ start:28 stop:2823 length:2796 start_codon:yes stop_codon:yes gene_type:complete
MSIFHNNVLLGASGNQGEATAYQIDRSLRFNDGDTAYLSRTPSSNGNRKTWTFSFWTKRCTLGENALLSVDTTSDSKHALLRFESDDTLTFYVGYLTSYGFQTEQSFRDTNAWYHFVLTFDATATGSNKVRLYVNGSEITEFSADTRSSITNQDWGINQSNILHVIGKNGTSDATYYDGYLADVQLVDGQALAAGSFGEYDSNNNWNPKEYSGSYGTNGFHLDFSDDSSTTSLGADTNVASNNWTLNNFTASSSNAQSITGITFTGNSNAGQSMREFFIGTTSVTSSVYDSASNNITQYDSGQNSGSFPNAHDGDESTNLDWKFGTISYSFTGQSASYVDFIGNMNNGSVTINSTTYSAPYGIAGTSSGGRTIYRIYLVEPSDVDSLIDTPTNYTADSGNNGGNYCTWNPLNVDKPTGAAGLSELSNGNLETSGNNTDAVGTIGVSSGKWYFEVTRTSGGGNDTNGVGFYIANTSEEAIYRDGGLFQYNASSSSYGDTWSTNGVVIGVALDLDNTSITFYKNGTSQGVAKSDLPAGTWIPLLLNRNTSTFVANFGQRPFEHTPPTNHLSLCTANLDDSDYNTVPDGTAGFAVTTYAGNGGTKTITGINHAPDFVWIKCRDDDVSHQLFDQVRGHSKNLKTNSRDNEATNHVYGYLSAFTSDGYTLTDGTSDDFNVNGGTETYVGWSWYAGGSTSANSTGSIPSTVRASSTHGFSIVKYEGSGSNDTVGHGLSSPPEWIIFKDINRNDEPWFSWHSVLGNEAYLFLNTTAAASTSQSDFMNSTSPTSSVFSVGNATGKQNRDGSNFLALCWHSVPGFSSFGKINGNGNNDGPFVYTGFRPAYVMIKPLYSYSGGSTIIANTGWYIYDTGRSTYNPSGDILGADRHNDEENDATDIDFLSNGFKLRNVRAVNTTDDAVYMAFAEHPFKTARAR